MSAGSKGPMSLALWGGVGLLVMALGWFFPVRVQQPASPAVRVIKYADLATEVLQLRGKVVLVDVWHTT